MLAKPIDTSKFYYKKQNIGVEILENRLKINVEISGKTYNVFVTVYGRQINLDYSFHLLGNDIEKERSVFIIDYCVFHVIDENDTIYPVLNKVLNLENLLEEFEKHLEVEDKKIIIKDEDKLKEMFYNNIKYYLDNMHLDWVGICESMNK